VKRSLADLAPRYDPTPDWDGVRYTHSSDPRESGEKLIPVPDGIWVAVHLVEKMREEFIIADFAVFGSELKCLRYATANGWKAMKLPTGISFSTGKL